MFAATMLMYNSTMMRYLLCFAFILTAAADCYAYTLPDLGEPASSVLSISKEEELGRQFMRSVKQQVRLVDDPLLRDYIRHLGYRLAAQSNRSAKSYHFFIVQDDTINAFSGPGGYIGVNSGLILRTKKESELAGVLSHEIAHVSQQHFAQLIAEQKTVNLAALGGMLAAIAIGMKNPEAGFGVMAASSAGGIQKAINFTRAKEKEADRIGMQILSKAGFDPCAMPIFFDELEKGNRFNNVQEIPELLLTHPLTENRLADAYNRCEEYPKKRMYRTVVSPFVFALLKDRLKVNSINNPTYFALECAKKLKSRRGGKHRLSVLRYQYVLALLKSGDTKKALKNNNILIKKHSKQIIFYLTEANIKESQNKRHEARQILSNLYRQYSKNYGVMIEYASLLIHEERYKQAMQILQAHQSDYQEDETFLLLLATSQGRNGCLSSAYQTRAKIYELEGEYPAAVEQLNIALKYAHQPAAIVQINNQLQKLRDQM